MLTVLYGCLNAKIEDEAKTLNICFCSKIRRIFNTITDF